MSAIPSRTRSLRKPAEAGSRHDRPSAESIESSSATRPPASERNSQSPSRLPVKPTTRSSSAAAAQLAASTTSISNNASMRPPPPRANVGKPTTSGLQRSTSNRRPNPPAKADPVKPTDSGLQRSTSNRRSNPPITADPVKQDRSRPPISISRHLRHASTSSSLSTSTQSQGHTRAKSSSTLLNAPTSLRPPSRQSAGAPKQQLSHTESQLRRPAFNTHQQHFSPAKNLAPKPHPAAFLAPPSPSKLPLNIAISAETAKLQNELLQLHLLHKDAARVEKEWRASAKKKLGARFQFVVQRNQELVQLEVQETGKINAAALKNWQDMGTPGWGLEEKIQVLADVVTGVWNLGESGGKYARIVRKFETWLSTCQDILEARVHDEGLENDEVLFLEELDAGWRDDCLLIGRKLESWRDQLKSLRSPDSGSSLATMVEGCQRLVKGMLMELSVMAQIERDAVRMEVDWIKSMNDDIMDDDKDIPTAGAIWRAQ